MSQIFDIVERPNSVKNRFSREAMKIHGNWHGRRQNSDVAPQSDTERVVVVLFPENYVF